MQIEIKNPRYIQLMIARCNKAEDIKAQMLQTQYLKHRVENYAFNKANQVQSEIGILNISDKQTRLLQKMANKKIKGLIMQEFAEEYEPIMIIEGCFIK